MKTKLFTAMLWLAAFSPIFANSATIQSARPAGFCIACAKPTGLSASNQTGTTALLAWSAVAGAGSYRIEVENGSGNPNFFKVETNVTGTSYSVSGLLPNLNYKFKVRSKCGGGKSDWTEWFSFNASTGTGGGTGGGVCSTPGGMLTSNLTPTTATLSWNAVPGVSGYRINIEKGSGSPFPFNLTVNLPSGTTSYTVTGLLPGRSYKWKVRSLCGSQTSDWSPRLNFTTPQNIVGGPGGSQFGMNSSPSQMVAQPSLNVYPNPTEGQLTVSFEGSQERVSVRVVNLLGKTMMVAEAEPDEQIQLELSNLPAGIYLVLAQRGSTKMTQKITLRK